MAAVPALLLLVSLSLADDFLFKSMLKDFYPDDVINGDGGGESYSLYSGYEFCRGHLLWCARVMGAGGW